MRRSLVAAALGGAVLVGSTGPTLAAMPPSARQEHLPLEQLMVRVQERYRTLGDLRARFVQRKIPRPGLPAKLAEGVWYVRSPGLLRIEYEDPPNVFVADGHALYWYLPQDNQVQILEQDATDPTHTPTLYLTGRGDLQRDFRISGTEWDTRLDPGNVQVRLDPVQQDARFSHLILEIRPDTALIARLVSFGLLGETSDFQFHDMETDAGLADDLFRFTIPAGVQVERLGANN